MEIWLRKLKSNTHKYRIYGKISLLSIASRSALGLMLPLIVWVQGTILPGVKRRGHETDHSPPSSVEVKNGGAISPLGWVWLRGLSHEVSSPAQTLGSWVRIPIKPWMSVCVYSVFVLFCVQVAALRPADPPFKESYRLCKRTRNWKSGQDQTKGCRAVDR
jgi:hypothetical protein